MFKQSSEDRKGTMMLFRVIDAIKKGTPLPKGHGRLIDADKLKHRYIASQGDTVDDKAWITAIRRSINEAPTIIEADTTESEVEE